MLNHWFLSTSAARELGLQTNGRGSRGGSSVIAFLDQSRHRAGRTESPEDLIASLKSGFYVTEVFGQGVNMVTGEYSRGASGFWIENGELSYPVSEVTIASNLKDMFLRMVPASDLDRNYRHGGADASHRRHDPCRKLTPVSADLDADLELLRDAARGGGAHRHALFPAETRKSG